MTTLREQLEAKIERDAEKEYPRFDSFGNFSRQQYMIEGANSLLELVVKLDEALAWYENQHETSVIQKTVYPKNYAKEAREELKRWVKS